MAFLWTLHLQRWVIEDGQPELRVGEVFDWPVTFCADIRLGRSVEKTKIAIPRPGNYYHVNAEVIYISKDPTQAGCILDFGIKAISELGGLVGVPLPSKCKEGDFVTGEIRLDLALCTVVHPHNIDRKWRVENISADLSNYCAKPGDDFPSVYQMTTSTDAVKAPSYVLHCSAIDP